ncbi:hypothetical protein NC651_030224 [Populus alba x Populus x berolinensis]|nr:hypothetical protein NC651_030224 [Populus alba x Populus x berolinensis]
MWTPRENGGVTTDRETQLISGVKATSWHKNVMTSHTHPKLRQKCVNVIHIVYWYWCVGMLEPSDDAGKLKETEEKKRVQIEGPMIGGALETGSYGIKFHIN